MQKIKVYIMSIAIALAVGGLSALLTKDSMDIYGSIVKPPLSPPAIVFPIVWTILFILMGISSAIIYLKGKANNNVNIADAMFLYILNLIVNFSWSIIFFNFRMFLLSFICIIILWLIIIAMKVAFGKVSKLSAYLQIPYLLWVTFAGYLNLAIYLLNNRI